MSNDLAINIARDYSRFPSGRDQRDGPNNGQRFRDEVLVPKLREAEARSVKLIVQLEGVLSFGSSFLEEAFGGLVRVHKMRKSDLARTLEIQAGPAALERYSEAITRYIAEA